MWFEKISFEQWHKDLPQNNVDEFTARRWYENIQLPKQATSSSAGMDFIIPYNLTIKPHGKARISTGVRWVCSDEYRGFFYLMLVPRSSMGKVGFRLQNTIGICDSDYSDADNEGHIMLMVENTSDDEIILSAGQRIVQGIVTGYTICDGAEADDDTKRNGGFGSTDKKGE